MFGVNETIGIQALKLSIPMSLATRCAIFGLLVFQSLYPCQVFAVQDNYEQLERAATLLRAGDTTAAETELLNILKKHPRDSNALNLLGVIRAQQKRASEAEKLFHTAIRQSPKLTGPYINLGRLYLEQGKPALALTAYQQAALVAPNNQEVQYQLAMLYAASRDFSKALAHLNNIRREGWRPEEYFLATTSHLALNQKREALELISTLKTRSTLNDEQTAVLASVLVKNNLPDDAINLLESYTRTNPSSFQIELELGDASSAKKEWPRAEEHYLAAIKLNSNSIVALRGLARAATALGDAEKSLAYLVQAKKTAPNNPAVLYDFAVAAFRMNLILDALPVAEQLYNKEPNNPSYIHLLAVCKFRRDLKADAEKLLRRYIELRPQDTLGHYLLGITLYTVKKTSEARAAFEQSLRVGRNPDSEYMLGVIAQAEGEKEVAALRLERIKPDCGCYAAAQTLLGTVYAEQNNNEAARLTLERATQLNPKDLRAHYQLGLIYSKLGEKEKAQQMFTIADRLRQEQRTEEVTTFKLIDSP